MPVYGLWFLVVINSAIFIIFAFSFARPRSARDWRSFGAFSAFIVALFTEMYGFPLTIYLLSGWIAKRYPGLDLFSHEAGHLWHTLLRWEGDPHFDPLHLLSIVLIFGGFLLLGSAWKRYSMRHSAVTTSPPAVHTRIYATPSTPGLC
jgi:hypothetical protein